MSIPTDAPTGEQPTQALDTLPATAATLRRRLLILSEAIMPLFRAMQEDKLQEARSQGDKRRAGKLNTTLLLMPLVGKMADLFRAEIVKQSDSGLIRSHHSMRRMLLDADNSALTDEEYYTAVLDEMEQSSPDMAQTFAEVLADALVKYGNAEN